MFPLTIGARASALARAQAEWVADRFREIHPDARVDFDFIRTHGDAVPDRPLSHFSDIGVFVREIEAALLEGVLDCAVHSLKDLPTRMPDGLTLAAIPEREDARDALIVNGVSGGAADARELLRSLPSGARVGTSSLRRKAQLLRARSDLEIVDIRGNVDTRMEKLVAGRYDAIVLAAAGLHRLGLADRITAYLPFAMMLPAPGQGALAVQARSDDYDTLYRLKALDHWPTRTAITAERVFLETLGGGCRAPIGAYAEVSGHNMMVSGFVGGEDGEHGTRHRYSGRSDNPEGAGDKLARMMRPAF